MSKPGLRYEEVEAELESWSGGSGDVGDSPKAARIAREAAELFARYGYRRTSMDEVARAAGIAKGTLYLYFKNKAELCFRVLMDEKKRALPRFREVFSENLDPEARLFRYVEQSLLFVEESPLSRMLLRGDREIQLFLDELPEGLRDQLESRRTDYLLALLAGVGHFDALPEDERRERSQTLIALLQSGVFLLDARPPAIAPEDFTRQVAKILTHGVGAP